MRQTIVNNKFIADLAIKASTAGESRTLSIKNTDNSDSASKAKLQLTTGGASGGDPTISLSVTAATACIGMDNSDSDYFKISRSTVPETTTALKVAGGNINRPLQSGFRATQNSTVSNFAGDLKFYTIICETTEFNIGSDYNIGTGIFTAPIAGNYFFCAASQLSDCSVNNFTSINIITTSYTYSDAFGGGKDGAYVLNMISAITPMAAGDTAYVSLYAADSSKRDDLAFADFYGFLLN